MYLDNTALVDTHCHLWDKEISGRTWLSPELKQLYRSYSPADLEGASKSVGIDACVVIEAGMTEEENSHLRRMANSSAHIAGFLTYLDLARPESLQELDRWGQEAKFRGVRMRFEGHKDANILKRPSVIEGLKEVSRRGLVFDFLVTVEQLAGILKVYEDVPELKGVIEHLAKPDMADKKDLTQWQETMQKLAAQTSVMCKLSLSPRADQMRSLLSHPSCGWSLEKIRPYVRFMVDHFGCDRLMWGSDWPICLVMSDYQGTWQVMDQILAGVTEEEKDKVYGRNAISFYRLTAERKTK